MSENTFVKELINTLVMGFEQKGKNTDYDTALSQMIKIGLSTCMALNEVDTVQSFNNLITNLRKEMSDETEMGIVINLIGDWRKMEKNEK